MAHAPIRRGFTLVELLVVITIIVLLLALLVPALDKAVEAAERVRCSANLHAWGVSIPQHYLDHRRKLLITSMHNLFDTNSGALPNHPYYRKTPFKPGQFTLDEIGPYVGSRVENGRAVSVGPLWYCPSSKETFFQGGEHDKNAQTQEGTQVADNALDSFMYNDYAYFGQLGEPAYSHHATKPEQLIGKSLEPGKLLMADTIFRWNVDRGQWWFNHSEVGASMHSSYNRHPVWANAPPPITGTSQLFGDGSVAWKDASRFNPQEMHDWLQTQGYVSEGGAATPAANLNYY